MPALQPTDIIAVIGAGTMGAGIAQVAAKAGHEVLLFDVNPDAISKGIDKLHQGLTKLIARKKMTEDEVNDLLSRIKPCTELAELKNCALVIEAIVEKLEVKQTLFCDLEKICSKDTIFATNTSSISITSIGSALKKPQRLLAMHFFNPAPILKLVEVVSGLATDKSVLQKIYNTAKQWGKEPVYAKSSPGFIVNRVARPFYAEALRALEENAANIATIDTGLRELGGFKMGAFELMDLIGNDVNYAVTESVFNSYYQDPRFKPSLAQLELVNAGYLGRKSGRGFYDYENEGQNQVIKTEPSFPKPMDISVYGDLGIAEKLVDRASKHNIEINRKPALQSSNLNKTFVIDGVHLCMSNGCTATQKSAETGHRDVVLFDLALDYTNTKRIFLTKAEQTSRSALNIIIGFFQSMEIEVTVINDIAGMIILRTVCMIINEAADTVYQGVASMSDVDLAMRKGVNYPMGPFAWADEIGVKAIYTTLQNIFTSYAEDRYRPSPLIRTKYYAHQPFNVS